MSLKEFCSFPWKRSHPAYEASQYAIKPAPEFSTAEVVTASVYRACGFPGYAETEVPKAGRELDKRSVRTKHTAEKPGHISLEAWRLVLHGVLESPKQPNQSTKRFLSLCPVIPDASLYSGSARLAGNSWNPGSLVRRIVAMGSKSAVEAHVLWDHLFEALSVKDDDDIWARWLHEEFGRHRTVAADWKGTLIEDSKDIQYSDNARMRIPAQQFVRDLGAVIDAKSSMTRRQWVSLLESILRLGVVTHVLWLCRVNERLWSATSAILGRGGGFVPSDELELREHVLAGEAKYLSYGAQAMPIIRNFASGYLVARVGINLVLWMLSEAGSPTTSLGSQSEIWNFLGEVRRRKQELVDGGFADMLSHIHDDEARAIACKKGIGSNITEFARYTLGQRQTSNESLRGYDQSYFLAKRSAAKNSPWVVSLGPVAVLAIAHCCLREASGPRSIKKLSSHLSSYGMEVDTDDIASGELGKKLRMLGIVLDSPDAETGMLLVPPFSSSASWSAK